MDCVGVIAKLKSIAYVLCHSVKGNSVCIWLSGNFRMQPLLACVFFSLFFQIHDEAPVVARVRVVWGQGEKISDSGASLPSKLTWAFLPFVAVCLLWVLVTTCCGIDFLVNIYPALRTRKKVVLCIPSEL